MGRRNDKRKGVVEAREGESFKKAHKRDEIDRQAIEALLTRDPNASIRIGASPRPAHSVSASSPDSPRAPSSPPSRVPFVPPSRMPSAAPSSAPSRAPSSAPSRAESAAQASTSLGASQSRESATQHEGRPEKKNKRGPTRLRTLASQTREVVHFNDRGQPIGENSDKVSSYMGALGRDMVRIIVPNWHLVPQEAKEELSKLLKLRFDGLEDDMKKKIVQHIGTLWQSWKLRVTSDLKQGLEDGWSDDEINSKLQPEGVDLAD
ncbi:hypothetical protein Sjap_007639 [Stephania japonica]|uniref:Uncharacterized protein n=1 Tax=Stephania japonica TaxID=461633 RepID=A0AAP0JNV7_9MAGN